MPKLNAHAKSSEMFDVAKYPTATYSGKFTKWNGDAPAEAQGTFTLHGVTKPLTLDDQLVQMLHAPGDQKASLRRGRIGDLNRATSASTTAPLTASSRK
jgi:polyisoprenoid-binding protein YceI